MLPGNFEGLLSYSGKKLLLLYFSIISSFTVLCSDELVKYMQYVKTLDYSEEPNYTKCKDFFVNALKANGWKNDGKLDFDAEKPSAPKRVCQKTYSLPFLLSFYSRVLIS